MRFRCLSASFLIPMIHLAACSTPAPAPTPNPNIGKFEPAPCPVKLPEGIELGENVDFGYVTVPERHAHQADVDHPGTGGAGAEQAGDEREREDPHGGSGGRCELTSCRSADETNDKRMTKRGPEGLVAATFGLGEARAAV